MTTLPLIQDCVLIAIGTVGFTVNGDAVLVGNLTDAASAIDVQTGAIAYVLAGESNTYSGAGSVEPLASDRAVWNALNFSSRHTNDIDNGIHWTQAELDLRYGISIAAGTGITATPDPIVLTGTIALADTAVTPGSYKTSNITVDQQGRLTAAANGALDDLSDVNATTPTDGQALVWDTGTSKWIPGTVATTGAINVYNETQTADGVNTIYYLTNIAAPSTIRVYIDGIRQPASDDSAATDIVTFDVAPDAGALLLFDYEMDTA